MKRTEKNYLAQTGAKNAGVSSQPTSSSPILEEIIITDPDTVPILFHPEKQKLLRFLIQDEYTIIALSKMTDMNPGTIKRHLTDLVTYGLAVQSRDDQNEYGIKMKFYRATAKKYRIEITWQP
jgi:DNA-binding transcriptional ArsR family regulator